jgi:hypothetical protein
MKILDCENIESINSSLKGIMNISKREIKKFLLDFNMNQYYDTHRNYPGTPDELLVHLFEEKYKKRYKIDITYWFHLTRTFESNKFTEGILPIGENINLIWDSLFSLVDDKLTKIEWNKFREKLENDEKNFLADDYRLRINKTYSGLFSGPFAILNKAFAFIADEVGNYDYLRRGPEVVECICNYFDEIYEYNLLQLYIDNTKPCIVKFKFNGGKSDYIGNMLCYLYSIYHNEKLTLYCNNCFDGKGIRVPPENILNIEFIHDC